MPGGGELDYSAPASDSTGESPIATLFNNGIDIARNLDPKDKVTFLLSIQGNAGKLVERGILEMRNPVSPTSKGWWELTDDGEKLPAEIYPELEPAIANRAVWSRRRGNSIWSANFYAD